MTMYYVGIDVGGTNLVAGLVDREGSILRKAGVPVDKSLDGAGLCRQLVRLAVEVCREEGGALDQIQAVGAGFPGLVDNRRGGPDRQYALQGYAGASVVPAGVGCAVLFGQRR